MRFGGMWRRTRLWQAAMACRPRRPGGRRRWGRTGRCGCRDIAAALGVAEEAQHGRRPVMFAVPAEEAGVGEGAAPGCAGQGGAREACRVVRPEAEEDLTDEVVYQRHLRRRCTHRVVRRRGPRGGGRQVSCCSLARLCGSIRLDKWAGRFGSGDISLCDFQFWFFFQKEKSLWFHIYFFIKDFIFSGFFFEKSKKN